MINRITANDLKVKGVSALDEMVSENNGLVITVRGMEKYVLLSIETYNHLREFELDAAIRETKIEMESSRYHSGSIEEHMKRIVNV